MSFGRRSFGRSSPPSVFWSLGPSSLGPLVPWSFCGLLTTRYSLRVAVTSTLTFNLNRSARRVRSHPCFGVSELLSGMTALFRMAD